MNKNNQLSILVVDDDSGHRKMLHTLLNDWGYTVVGASNGQEAVDFCKERPFDLVLMDVRMPKKSGLEALPEIKAHNPAIPVLIMTAFGDVEAAVTAIKAGAYDYLTKPLDFEKLKVALRNIFEFVSLKQENTALTENLNSVLGTSEIIGQSSAMHNILNLVQTIAPSEATVLINGESGTGKELIAKAIHMNSTRRAAPYVAFNCAAITESLFESELFGHEKGAFTGADRRRDGRFVAAEKGTLFLDEVGEIPLLMQAKLLRVLQEREVQPVGSDKTIAIDVRIITATNRNLVEEVEAGRFREDLYYRINVVCLDLPPLRTRPEDIPLLAQHFLNKFTKQNGKNVKGFTPAAMDALIHYPWPGNVRELENVIERAVVLLLSEFVSEHELPPQVLRYHAPHGLVSAGVVSAQPQSQFQAQVQDQDQVQVQVQALPQFSPGRPSQAEASQVEASQAQFSQAEAHLAQSSQTNFASSELISPEILLAENNRAENNRAGTAHTVSVAAQAQTKKMPPPTTLKDMEREMILACLAETGGNKSETAKRLGITRKTLHLKLQKFAEENGL